LGLQASIGERRFSFSVNFEGTTQRGDIRAHSNKMIYESPYNAGFEFRDIDIPQLILECNSRNTVPEKPAIIDGYTGQVVYTYRSLREDITTFAGFLQHQLRVGRGDVVSYLSLNTVR
jgi:hypothetical protein